jgi:uncharacterized damage-inducible protein DinB
MTLVQQAEAEIRAARTYVTHLLQDLDDADWFRQPHEGITHVAWQVGHLAVAQYRLTLERQRGERPEDEHLISSDFRRHFGKGSTPDPVAANNPTCDEIRQVFHGVYDRALEEIAAFTDAEVDETVAPPAHPMFSTRLEALQWCSNHEFIHAGQIALLRRLLGKPPIR